MEKRARYVNIATVFRTIYTSRMENPFDPLFFMYSGNISWERTLLRDLTETRIQTPPFARPVRDTKTTVNVKFRVGLIKLDFDEKNKVLSLSTWTKYVSILSVFVDKLWVTCIS